MDGIFDTEIKAGRNLVWELEWLHTNEDGSTGNPVDLIAYTRLIYNLQTNEAVPVEVLTVDSDTPAQSTWLTIASPATLGIIRFDIPGTALTWQPSNSGKWIHELVLLDSAGGPITIFQGDVLYKLPAVSLTP